MKKEGIRLEVVKRRVRHGSTKKKKKKQNCIAMGRHIETTRGWTYPVWFKRMGKDYVLFHKESYLSSMKTLGGLGSSYKDGCHQE